MAGGKLWAIVPDQFDPEFTAYPDGAFHADSATHQFDQLLGYHQADASAFLGAGLLPQAIERLKQLHQLFRRQSGSAVFDADANAFRGSCGALYLDRSLFAVVFDGIGKQVDQNLFYPGPVGIGKPGVIERKKV